MRGSNGEAEGIYVGGACSTHFWSEIMNSMRGKVSRRRKDNTKIDLKEIGWVDMD